jgi:hypothetical protein
MSLCCHCEEQAILYCAKCEDIFCAECARLHVRMFTETGEIFLEACMYPIKDREK